MLGKNSAVWTAFSARFSVNGKSLFLESLVLLHNVIEVVTGKILFLIIVWPDEPGVVHCHKEEDFPHY